MLRPLIDDDLAARAATPAVDMRTIELHESAMSDRRATHGPDPHREWNVGREPFELVSLADNPARLHRTRAKRTRRGVMRTRSRMGGRHRARLSISSRRAEGTRAGRARFSRLQLQERRDDIRRAAAAIELPARLVRFDRNGAAAIGAVKVIGSGGGATRCRLARHAQVR